MVYKYRNFLGPSLKKILGVPNGDKIFIQKEVRRENKKINALYLSKISGRPRGGEARGHCFRFLFVGQPLLLILLS
jgi:hypothetical protein